MTGTGRGRKGVPKPGSGNRTGPRGHGHGRPTKRITLDDDIALRLHRVAPTKEQLQEWVNTLIRGHLDKEEKDVQS